MLHNSEDIVPQEGVEPSRLAAAAFEVAVSTIPPPGQLLALFLYGVVMRPPYGARTRKSRIESPVSLTSSSNGDYVVVNRF